MLTADDASVLHVLKRAARNNRPLKTFTELADLHVAVQQAEPIPSHTKSASIRSLTLVGDEHAPMWILDYGYRTRTRRDARQGSYALLRRGVPG